MSSLADAEFEWEQNQIQQIFSGAIYVLLTIWFCGNYFKSKLRVHLVLAASTALSTVDQTLVSFIRPLCEAPGEWTIFLEGQIERMCEVGAFLLYIVFVISRLSSFNIMLPGLQKWKLPLIAYSYSISISHLIREVFVDIRIYNGSPPLSEDISDFMYLISLLSFFAINFSINYTIAKCFIKHALESKARVTLEPKCKRLLFLVYISIATTLIGTVLFNINFDPHDLPLFHSMTALATMTIAAHFYFEWLYQVLLTKILTGSSFNSTLPDASSAAMVE